MQAIVIKYLPATATKPSRYKASCVSGSITTSCGHYCDTNDRDDQRMAAEALVEKMGWKQHGTLIEAGHPDAVSSVYVFRTPNNIGGAVTRYAATYVNANGMRTFIGPAQGRYMHATAQEARDEYQAILLGTPAYRRSEVWGANPRFDVRPVECYPGHFDPCGIWFEV